MQNNLTSEQIERYQADGFLLVIDGFLDAAELAHWSAVTDEAVSQRLEDFQKEAAKNAAVNAAAFTNQFDPDNFYAQVFTQCLKLLETHDGMREIMLDPKLGKVAAELAQVDGIRIWHDQALFKPPFGNPTAWHLDNPFWSFSSRQSLSIWVALDDATWQNGCLYYVPGTQKTANWENVGIGMNQGDLFKVFPQWREIGTVGCPCKAGSAVFHNGLTAHGAGANMTNRARRAMTCAYMPDGSTFNGQSNVLSSAYLETLKIGDVLNNDKVNPLVYSR